LLYRRAPPRAHRERLLLAKIALDELDPGQRIHLQQVQRDHPAAVPDLLRRVLAPRARRGAQVHHRHAGFSTRSFSWISISL
jgi:hypothetical protein